MPDSPEDARAIHHLFHERLAGLPIGRRADLMWFVLDAVVAEGERSGW